MAISSNKKFPSEPNQLQSEKMDCKRLRTYEGFENVAEDEANFIIEQLEALALILYKQIIAETENE
jgi:hypothetical protein